MCLCWLAAKKALQPVTFYTLQLSALPPQQKRFLARLKLRVAKTIFWNSFFSQDGARST